MAQIFISYRRSDSTAISGRVYDRLREEFGKENIFKDVDDIPAGRDFRGVLREATANCNVMLVVIGPNWLNAADSAGNKRLDDPGDFVRLEVETGLQRDGVLVIPLLVHNAPPPRAADLPDTLKELAYNNAMTVRDDPDFHRDVDRLIAQLRPHLKLTTWHLPAIDWRWLIAAIFIPLLAALITILPTLIQNAQNAAATQSILDNQQAQTRAAQTPTASYTPKPNTPTPMPTETATATITPSPRKATTSQSESSQFSPLWLLGMGILTLVFLVIIPKILEAVTKAHQTELKRIHDQTLEDIKRIHNQRLEDIKPRSPDKGVRFKGKDRNKPLSWTFSLKHIPHSSYRIGYVDDQILHNYDIPLHEGQAEDVYAVVSYDINEDKYYISNLGRKDIYVKHEKVKQNDEVPLIHLSEVKFGQVTYIFEDMNLRKRATRKKKDTPDTLNL